MLVKNFSEAKRRVLDLLESKSIHRRGNLSSVVKQLLKKREKILQIANTNKTPFYLFDREELLLSLRSFSAAFNSPQLFFKPYYAIKSNPHSFIIKTVLENGFGLDSSSGRELEIALKQQAKDILFSGPGKTEKELALAVKNNTKNIVNIDSFRELEKLGGIAKKEKKRIKAGVRIFSQNCGSWSKFGIPLAKLTDFWQKARTYPYVKLQGIQFHMSWNKDASPYQAMIKQLASYLKNKFNPEMRNEIKFIDIGGGFLPYSADGYFPWDLPQGRLIKIADEYFDKQSEFIDKYYLSESIPLENYADGIVEAIRQYLTPLVKSSYYLEPGKIISHKAMHIILKVVDIKKRGVVITDGGTNIIGWERFESEYFPLINLTHPSTKEINCQFYGSLCTPHDIWGYYCYADKIEEEDYILVPYQGAYALSLAQNFIKPIPEVHILPR